MENYYFPDLPRTAQELISIKNLKEVFDPSITFNNNPTLITNFFFSKTFRIGFSFEMNF